MSAYVHEHALLLIGSNKPSKNCEHDGIERDANFYLTHPFLDLVSGRSSKWHSAHARVGAVQPLNLEANLEMALFGVSNFERRFEAACHMPETAEVLQGKCCYNLHSLALMRLSLHTTTISEAKQKIKFCNQRKSLMQA